MNIPQYVKLARKILNEAAGSEGMQYLVEAKAGLKAFQNELLTIDEVRSINGITTARARFAYPHDYGFALNTIKENLNDIDIISLSLVY